MTIILKRLSLVFGLILVLVLTYYLYERYRFSQSLAVLQWSIPDYSKETEKIEAFVNENKHSLESNLAASLVLSSDNKLLHKYLDLARGKYQSPLVYSALYALDTDLFEKNLEHNLKSWIELDSSDAYPHLIRIQKFLSQKNFDQVKKELKLVHQKSIQENYLGLYFSLADFYQFMGADERKAKIFSFSYLAQSISQQLVLGVSNWLGYLTGDSKGEQKEILNQEELDVLYGLSRLFNTSSILLDRMIANAGESLYWYYLSKDITKSSYSKELIDENISRLIEEDKCLQILSKSVSQWYTGLDKLSHEDQIKPLTS